MLLNPGAPFDYNGGAYLYPDIRMVYWAGGNPFHHQQDINKLVHAWRRPETVIAHEPWWNPLARHADIVLPCATTLERNDLGIARDEAHLFAMHRAVPPFGEARSDYDILAEIAHGRARADSVIVGFAAETGDDTGSVLDLARAKLARKGCDLLVVNDVSGGAVFGQPDNQAVILAADGGRTDVPRGSKTALAHVVWDEVAHRLHHGPDDPGSPGAPVG